jgi:demethylmenaquinone methyltransferase/2-methoxy-6-polyprenyl-1,4-benzoquinol methylase
MSQTEKETTHFGFKDVPRDEKAGLVKGVFDQVASRYDLMNDLMSLGMHRAWKKSMIHLVEMRAGMQILDVAGGTGDIGFALLEQIHRKQLRGEVTICDINAAMLSEGRDRAVNRNILADVEWVCGNAESLPFENNRFDAYTIAFGIRNVTDIPAALKEAYRVMKPGGKFYCLEFSRVTSQTLAHLYHSYSFHVIPRVGKMVVGDGAPYQYLVESIQKFPDQKTFAAMIRDAGFSQVRFENMTGGVVALHTGYKT